MTAPPPDIAPAEPERIWDLPTRLLKWAIALSVTLAVLTGGSAQRETAALHLTLGYGVAGLLMARLIWGAWAGGASGLRHLAPRPRALLADLRQFGAPAPSRWPGHSPLAGLAIAGLFLILAILTLTGLAAGADDPSAAGPLAPALSAEARARAAAWHGTAVNMLLIWIGLHLSAVAYYAVWKSEDLIGPMISGWKAVRRRDR